MMFLLVIFRLMVRGVKTMLKVMVMIVVGLMLQMAVVNMLISMMEVLLKLGFIIMLVVHEHRLINMDKVALQNWLYSMFEDRFSLIKMMLQVWNFVRASKRRVYLKNGVDCVFREVNRLEVVLRIEFMVKHRLELLLHYGVCLMLLDGLYMMYLLF